MEQNIPQKAPFVVNLEKDKEYYWCSCGHSKNQPFCDGTHKGSEFRPVLFKAAETGKAYLCGCKKSKKTPFCDGTHNELK